MGACSECGEFNYELTLDDFSTDDIINELQNRLIIRSPNKFLWKRNYILDFIRENNNLLYDLLDQQKNELFEEARARFTIAELTERLKS